MKVLHLIDHLGLGGAQTCLLDLLEALSPEIESEVWTLSDRPLPSSAERLDSARVPHRSLRLSKRNPFGFVSLRSWLARERPELLHTHLEFSNVFGTAAAASLTGIRPLIVSHIDNDPFQHYGFFLRLGGRLIAPRVDAYVAISESMRQAIQRAFGERVTRVEIITPGLNLGRFNRERVDQARVERLRARANRVVGTVGRLADQKAYPILLEAIPSLLAEDSQTRVLFVGDGPRRSALERQARRLGIAEAVSFVGYQSDVTTCYAAMDVFVLPSRHEGFGTVFMEAMAMGVPVVASRVFGSVDAVRDGVTGILVPFGDPVALASAISRLHSEPQLRQTLVINAKEWVRRECSLDAMVAKTEALYMKLRQSKEPARDISP